MRLKWVCSLVLLATVPIAGGCHGQGAAGAPNDSADADSAAGPVVRVTTAKPQRKSIVRRTQQPGHVEALREAPLFANLAGYVIQLHADIGDIVQGPRYDAEGRQVEAGQVLAQLNVPELAEELRQKQALVAEAAAKVEQATAAAKVARAALTSSNAELEQAQALVDRTQADHDRYRSEYERFAELGTSSAVTPKIVEESRNRLRAAEAGQRDAASQVVGAQAAIDEAEARIEKAVADEAVAREQHNVAEADHARVLALIEYQNIRAPFDGTITERNVDLGHLVSAGAGQSEPLFRIAQSDVVRVFIEVPEVDATLAGPADSATIHVQALAGRDFSGEITRTAWALDSTTRTLRVEIDVPNPDGALRPGMYVNAIIDLDQRQSALSLPAAAVRSQDGQSWCLCVEGGQVVKRPIITGLTNGAEVEVVSGLSADADVIQSNLGSLAEGQKVEARAAEATPAK